MGHLHGDQEHEETLQQLPLAPLVQEDRLSLRSLAVGFRRSSRHALSSEELPLLQGNKMSATKLQQRARVPEAGLSRIQEMQTGPGDAQLGYSRIQVGEVGEGS